MTPNTNNTLAKFMCLKCGYIWESNPGPTNCLSCNHVYVKWLNYEKMREQWDKER